MATEFSRRTESLLDRAGAVCQHRGANLTELRRQVLGLILDAASPTGAYELLDRLRQTRRGAAPPTVYRALDFLLEHGLIHRVERLSAFVGCVAGCTADPLENAHTHAAQFLICRECGRV
ncbi:MAG: transcriptional repressor, partial [Nevskiales bacterium]